MDVFSVIYYHVNGSGGAAFGLFLLPGGLPRSHFTLLLRLIGWCLSLRTIPASSWFAGFLLRRFFQLRNNVPILEDLQMRKIHPCKLPVFASNACFLRLDLHGEDLSVGVILKKAFFVKGINQAKGQKR